jgi:hypothetical protein
MHQGVRAIFNRHKAQLKSKSDINLVHLVAMQVTDVSLELIYRNTGHLVTERDRHAIGHDHCYLLRERTSGLSGERNNRNHAGEPIAVVVRHYNDRTHTFLNMIAVVLRAVPPVNRTSTNFHDYTTFSKNAR